MTNKVSKVYQLFEESEAVWYDVYEAPGVEGCMITAEVPREDQSASAVRRHLLRRGADKAAVENDGALTSAISAKAPVVRRAARTGWRDAGQLFVTHRRVAGSLDAGTVVPPVCSLVGAAGQLQVCGTLKGWQDLVKVARHSTALTLALCLPFAAPLLTLVDRPSFALVLFAPSRAGKSFAQLVAASALGFGREQDLPSLNATQAGLLAAALAFNDHLLPINEVGTARGPKTEIYVALRDATYALMTGQDTLRHPSWTGGGGGTGTFQVICLLSSEVSPDAWAARNGQTRDEGEMARLIGVPVLASGRRTIFDRSPSKLSGDKLSDWEKNQFGRLRRELPTHRGVAFSRYLDVLLGDGERYRNRAPRLVAYFEARVVKTSMSPVARDIVAKFGVLFAGGILAIEAGILPLEKKMLGQAVRRACMAALLELPDPSGELRADLAILKERLASGAIIDLDACTPKQLRLLRNADGFHRPRSDGEEYVVRAQVFSSWFGTPLRNRRVLEWLDDEGLLEHSRDRTKTRSNEWAQKQIKWPDETRPRSISLYLPSGLTNFE